MSASWNYAEGTSNITRIHGNVEAFALLPKQIDSRNSDIVHHDSTGGLGVPAHFVLCLSKS